MTGVADPFAPYRPQLKAALSRTVDGVSLSHAALLKDALAAVEADATAPQPALLCLLTAEALGARPGDALPAATALALLAAMGSVFESIARDQTEGPLARSGMPRTLNAGDGFFALAQTSLLALEGTAERRLEATRLLDETARAYLEALNTRWDEAPSDGSYAALLAGACALGALVAGGDDATRARLADFGRSFNGPALATAALSDDARGRLQAAGRYISAAGKAGAA